MSSAQFKSPLRSNLQFQAISELPQAETTTQLQDISSPKQQFKAPMSFKHDVATASVLVIPQPLLNDDDTLLPLLNVTEIPSHSTVKQQILTPFHLRGRKAKFAISSVSLLLALLAIFVATMVFNSGSSLSPSTYLSQVSHISGKNTDTRSQSVDATAHIPAVLGDYINNFTTKFGPPTQDSNANSLLHYQPYHDAQSTNAYDIGVTKGTNNQLYAFSVTYNAPPNAPIGWQDGETLCHSFLPVDATHLQDTDFPDSSNYEQLYISATLAQKFDPALFTQGTGANVPLTKPGTVEIFYYYTTNGLGLDKHISSCVVSLGEQN